eukprot:310874-Pyramimonas_sp.AAC.1
MGADGELARRPSRMSDLSEDVWEDARELHERESHHEASIDEDASSTSPTAGDDASGDTERRRGGDNGNGIFYFPVVNAKVSGI